MNSLKGFVCCLAFAFSGLATAAPQANTLAWKVTEEKGVFGYIVYRAEHREGPFLRISRDIIRRHVAGKDSGTAETYRFVDADVVAGRTYYYFVDAISMNGRKHRLTGVQARAAPAR